MKQFTALVLLFLAALPLQAQLLAPEAMGPGTIETSFSFSLQSMSGSGSSSTNFLVSGRVGFFPIGGLEIEPEITLLKPEEGDLMYVFSGNLAYNFSLRSGNASPFILAGYGITNSIPVFDLPILNVDMTIGVLNLGTGLKVGLAENVLLRVEYRFQKYTGEEVRGSGGFSVTQDVDLTMHTVGAGISLLL